MKQFFYLFCIFILILLLLSCGNTNKKRNQTTTTGEDADITETTESAHTENTDVTGTTESADAGNTGEEKTPDTHPDSEPEETGPSSLTLNKQTFAPDEEMIITFTVPGEIADNAWIGIIPSEVPHGSHQENDNNDIDFDFLAGQTSGSTMLLAPHFKGAYDLRMSDPDTEKEIATVSFKVQ